MSWRKVPDDKGGGYEVRWRQGTRHRSRTFRSREDAKLFDAEVQRRARLGTLADLDAGIELLADFGTKWWRRSVQERLAVSTRRRYAEVWDAHVLPRLGDYQLRQLRAGVIEDELVSAMLADRVGLATVRKALYMLRSCLGYAVRRDLLLYNPAREVDLPKGRRRGVKPLPPEVVERMRARVSLRDATLLSVMYGAGLRPGEALALRDDSIRERTLLIESSISFGAEKDTKTRKARSVRSARTDRAGPGRLPAGHRQGAAREPVPLSASGRRALARLPQLASSCVQAGGAGCPAAQREGRHSAALRP